MSLGVYSLYVNLLFLYDDAQRKSNNELITSVKEVMFSLLLVSEFVCLLQGLRTNYSTGFHKSRRKRGTGPRKKPLDVGGNPDLDPDPGSLNGIFVILLRMGGLCLMNST